MVKCGMDETARIRQVNFCRLYPSETVSLAALVAALGRTPAFWSDLRNGRKSFGEKLARSIEDGAGLPALSLDRATTGAPRGRLSADLLERPESLTPDELARAEALLRVHLGMPTISSGKQDLPRAA